MSEIMGQDPTNDWSAGYHEKYEQWTERFKKSYEKMYRAIYDRAILLVCERVQDPFQKEHPRVLLCGTATSETTRNFTNFVYSENPQSLLYILDLNEAPLEASKTKLEGDANINLDRISFHEGNALESPFEDGSMDLIETDFFLQFFSPEDRRKLAVEWSRILSEDGAIMTRAFVPDGKIAKTIDRLRMSAGKRLELTTYPSSEEELSQIFAEVGLKADIVPMQYGPFHSHLLKHIILYRE